MQVRPTQVHVSLDAIAHNIALLRQQAPNNALCAVVKANAYGHGLVPVSRTAAAAGAAFLGVALVEEGVQLRNAGIKTPILVWGGALAGGFGSLVAHRLTPVLSAPEHIKGLAEAVQADPWPIHIEVDTGMARLGVALADLPGLLECIKACPKVRLDGVMSHLASADRHHPFNAVQLQRFEEVRRTVAQKGLQPRFFHIANSPATLSLPQTHTGLLRCGLAMYGLEPLQSGISAAWRPALSWTTAIVAIRPLAAGTPVSYGCRYVTQKPSRIATLAVGYADGYPRQVSHRAHVLVRGQRALVVGTVCMDLCMIDITDIPDAAVGDRAILIGSSPQGDGDCIGADDLAGWSNTISYETLCAISARVARHYDGDSTWSADR